MAKLPKINISDLLDAGVHFGHKTSRWNPKMAPYIHGVRDNVHIIDLKQTAGLMNMAMKTIYDVVRNHGKVLFVGTKIQAGSLIAQYAEQCGQYYVNHRWLGGMITNWPTVSKSIKTLEELEKILEDEEKVEAYTKKEILDLTRKKDKLEKAFGGIRNMGGKPDLIVIIDTNKEHIARKEAKVLKIPVVAIIDTNSDPDNLEYPVPGNDDAIRSITYYLEKFSGAVLAAIEDSLAESGVDLGEIAKGSEDEFAAAAKVTKLQNQKQKVSAAIEVKDDAKESAGPKVETKAEAQKNAAKASSEETKVEEKANE